MFRRGRIALRATAVILGSVVLLPSVARGGPQPSGCLSAEELEFASLVNAYREENGRKAVPLSRSLTTVAQWHTIDAAHARDVTGQFLRDPNCNLHSWFGLPGASYGPCCYTADHARASCMWDKPYELTQGRYPGDGFENAAYGYGSPEAALNGFKRSRAHREVILNGGPWQSVGFNAMGVGVDSIRRTYYLWFGQEVDSAGRPEACPSVRCPARPARSCRASFGAAELVVDETRLGDERLLVKWQQGRPIAAEAFGNPRARGGTQYAVCVYDDEDRLAGEYRVAAAGEKCGGARCWKRLGGTTGESTHVGYSYLDRKSRRDGIRALRLKSGKWRSQAIVRGVNNRRLGRQSLPTGVVDALRGSQRATIQLHASDVPLCLSASLRDVVTEDGKLFQARKTP